MALRTRPTQFPELGSGVATEQLTAASRLVSYLTGFAIQPNKAIVGGNAFAHESGIHQDGVIKNPLTYEIMTPQSVGLSGSQLTIGKLSGRQGLQGKLRELGYEIEGEALDEIYRQAVALADAKKEVTDADLHALARAALVRGAGLGRDRRLERDLVARRERDRLGHAHRSAGEERTAEATGNGPVNALFGAVDDALQPVLGWHPTLTEYEIKAVSAGEDAQGQVLVRCRRSSDEGPGALVVTGHGLSTNIIEASLEALPRGGQQAPRRRDQRGVGRVRRAAPGRDAAMTEGACRRPRRRYRVATIPGDGVGPEVVAAARRVVDAAGARLRVRGRLVGAPRRRRRDRRLRGRDPRRGPRRVRRGRRDPARRGRRPEVVRPGRDGPARAGALRAARRARPVREPAARSASSRRSSASSPLRPELLAGVDMVIVRELTGGIYFGDRTEASGEPGARTALDTLPYAEHEIAADRAARRSSSPGRRRGVVTSVDKANVLATLAPVAPGRRRGRGRVPRRRAQPPARRLVRDAAHPPAGRLRRHRHREPVRRHPVGRGAVLAGSLGVLPSASLGERRTEHGSSACTSRSTAPRRTSPVATSRTRSARSCRRRCCCGRRSGGPMRPMRSRRPSRAPSPTAGGRPTWPTPADAADGLVVVGTTGVRDGGRRGTRDRRRRRRCAA